ncbi:MAG: hypothetical protein OXR62_09020 [Ahrensia sp.]|nr:hypothetical protein [Ahrensia sp.]
MQESYDLAKSGVRPLPDGNTQLRMSQVIGSDQRFFDVVRQSKCDAQGNFEFTDLPAGEWVVVGIVRWVVSDIPQGSTLGTKITLSSGQQAKVLLSDTDRL